LCAQYERAALSAEHESLLLAVAQCAMTERGIDFKCAEHKAFARARGRNPLEGFGGALGLRHLHHPSPAVRWGAAASVGMFGGSALHEAVVKAIPEEKHPVVLARLLGVVGRTASRDPRVGELLMNMAEHKADVVRMEAISWLTTPFADRVEGSADKVIEMVQRDPSRQVRAHACEYSGRLVDERLVPLYKKLTQRPGRDPSIYTACMRGLMDLWTSLAPTAPSENAYKLSLVRLRDRPRSKDRPPWSIMSAFGRVPRGSPAWYDAKDVARALGDVVLDARASPMARTGAAGAIGELKDREELERLRAKLDAGAEEPGSRTALRAVEESLAKAR
jgi:hypothetical protein